MTEPTIVFSLFLIFTGAAVLATLALMARQALPVAYILLGALLGPHAFAVIQDPAAVADIAEIGIIFLLFLLGLDLTPQELVRSLGKSTLVTLASSLLFAAVGFGVAMAWGFPALESLIVGAAMMFSSTIIGLKLLPTTALHHQHTGEIIISVLLLQDIIAILVLLALEGLTTGAEGAGRPAWLPFLALPALVAGALLFERYVLIRFIRRFNKIREYIFLMAIGWCLGLAELAEQVGLSYEIGAFVAGVSLATNPIALYIVESLKPLRDFFLVLFFFSLGASFDTGMLGSVLIPTLVLGGLMLLLKPLVFGVLLQFMGEKRGLGFEVGSRLGQLSEFSLLIAVLALEQRVLSQSAAYLIQGATLLTLMISTYGVVLRYPTPVAVSDRLRRD